MFCSVCGTELVDEANFCWKCGRPQREDIVPPAGQAKKKARWEHCRITFYEKNTLLGKRYQLYAEGTDTDGKDYIIAEADLLIAPYNQGPRMQAIRNLVGKLEADGWELSSIPTNEREFLEYRFQRRLAD